MTGNIFLTSDLHFGHVKVAQLRGFDSVTEHDEVLCERWKKAIKPDDQVWVLGDIAMSSPFYALNLLQSLPGKKHLISGNHDAVHPMHKHWRKFVKHYAEVFDSVSIADEFKIAGRKYMLSHFPYCTDHTAEVRYMQWRLRDEGAWLLHGHVHRSYQINVSQREVHVGVDAWKLAPVSIHTLVKLIQESESEAA